MGAGVTEHVTELLSAYIDDQVTLPERRQVDEHLANCALCQADLADLRGLSGTLRLLPSAGAPRSFALGPQPTRPLALSGTWAGYLRALSSVAAALVVVVVSFSLIFQGLPRQASTIAAGEPFAASASSQDVAARAPAPQAGTGAARAVQPAASLAASAPAAGKPVAVAAASSAAQKPQPVASAPPAAPAATPSRSKNTINIPRLAGELLILLAALGIVGYSIRWWQT
jgi:Putative zinc-finger